MTNEELVIRIRAGIDVADNMCQLWQQNQGLIGKIACRYKGYEDVEDLKQEGYIGLCNAVEGYNPEEGTAFATYAVFWIRQSIQRYIYNCSAAVRIPEHRRQEIVKYRRVCAAFEKSYGRKPTDWEAGRFLDVNREGVSRIKEAAQMDSMASLDMPVGEDGEDTVGDLYPGASDVEESVLDAMQQEQLKAVIWPMVDALPEGQGKVIRMRYQEGLTLQETGNRIGCDIAQARVIQAKAMRELRKPGKAKQLRPFLQEIAEASAYRGSSTEQFNRTWTSSTERTALRLC